MADDRVNEGSTWPVVVAFFDTAGVAVAPTSARYRIDDVKSSTARKAPTDISGLGAVTSVTIEITAAENAIVNAANALEPRRLTVDFIYGAAKHGVSEYRYDLVNLKFAPVG